MTSLTSSRPSSGFRHGAGDPGRRGVRGMRTAGGGGAAGQPGDRPAVAAAVVVLLAVGQALEEVIGFLAELGERSGISPELLVPLYKAVGIALVVRVGGSLCRDAGESALASVVETAGAVCALVVSLPLLRAVVSLLLELME